jgi:hypothetical protein
MNTRRFFALILLSGLLMPGSALFAFAQSRSERGSKEYPQVRVTGRIELESLARQAGRQSITLTFLNTEEPLQYEMQVTHSSPIHFLLRPGRYQVIARGTKWLAQRVEIRVVGSSTKFQLLLPGGDANGDNRVDWDDLDLLADAFDSLPGMVNWDERADLDCDDDVDDDDADILFLNLFRYGD